MLQFGFVRLYTHLDRGKDWLQRYRAKQPLLACVLGFTDTGLIPGISAAGATPADRQYTAIADAEFLYAGVQPCPKYPLPPLHVGASPVLISRAVIAAQKIPVYVFNAGLPQPPAVPAIDLGGCPAQCLSQGQALPLEVVDHLLQQGLKWGAALATEVGSGYLVIGECVVGGTTTALAVLAGLGVAANGKINSSHSTCNHLQKWSLVETGLRQAGLWSVPQRPDNRPSGTEIIAAVGDPMQIVVAGMAIAASRTCGVLLAGGTQMLAVYELLHTIAQEQQLVWHPEQIVVGTTRWVAEDPTGDTIGLAQLIKPVPLIATPLSFASSQYEQFRAYEQGYVKEGVGAGGCAIAAHLYQGWEQAELLSAIESLTDQYYSRPNDA
ncbi:nicotinate mononucleotide-dependent phosphoribosyltransferase CobT [Pantanalinema sp. GBBB05]|uniref:nicotinate mononucleotide-dependent phosphoribosyltransferase CobT n=1 Tax=Pantanalinema sp. GBBB05 TaxID=2604139 RepID=UPI001DD53106|nr:TIGR00303 family protein [Pantanalinema sp. GBBB05]